MAGGFLPAPGTPFFLPSRSHLAVAAIAAAAVVFRGGGVVVVWWWEVVEFRMLVEFEPREFRHMMLLTPSKRRGHFNSAYLSSNLSAFA